MVDVNLMDFSGSEFEEEEEKFKKKSKDEVVM